MTTEKARDAHEGLEGDPGFVDEAQSGRATRVRQVRLEGF